MVAKRWIAPGGIQSPNPDDAAPAHLAAPGLARRRSRPGAQSITWAPSPHSTWAVVEQERHRIAQDLHDEVGHRITSALLRLDMAMERRQGEVTREDLSAVRSLLRECADGMHDVAFHLRPRVLADLGLLPAVQGLARRAEAVSGIRVPVSARGESTRLSPEIELAAFRIVQEAVTNALRHARASRITIKLLQSRHTLVVCIKDDGIGFDQEVGDARQRERSGLRGMAERAALAGGSLEVESTVRQGTTVRARFSPGKAAS